MPCQPRSPWLTPSVSSLWAEPSAYCYRADIFFVHPYRPRLALSALRLSPFMCSHSPLNLWAYLCDIGIVICIEVRAVALLSVLCIILFSCVIYVMRGKVFSFSLIHSFPCTLFTATEHHPVRCSQAPERQNIRTNQPFAVGASHHTIVCLSFGCSLSVYGFSLTLSCQSLVIISDSIVLSFFGHIPHLNRSFAYCM